jgi:hypothetical protein
LFPSLHPESQGTNLNHGNRKACCPLKNELVSLAISCENVLEPTTDLVVGGSNPSLNDHFCGANGALAAKIQLSAQKICLDTII